MDGPAAHFWPGGRAAELPRCRARSSQRQPNRTYGLLGTATARTRHACHTDAPCRTEELADAGRQSFGYFLGDRPVLLDKGLRNIQQTGLHRVGVCYHSTPKHGRSALSLSDGGAEATASAALSYRNCFTALRQEAYDVCGQIGRGLSCH